MPVGFSVFIDHFFLMKGLDFLYHSHFATHTYAQSVLYVIQRRVLAQQIHKLCDNSFSSTVKSAHNSGSH